MCFTLKSLANALQKYFEYDQIKTKIFGSKRQGYKAIEKEKKARKTINCHHSDVLWKFKRYLFLWNFHTKFSLFSTDFQFSTRMLIFRKQTRKQKISFSPSPSLKYLDFYDVSKNSEHINTFRGALTHKSPSQIPKFNFLEQKESQRPKRKSFQTFSIMANWNLLPKSHREKDNLIINSFKPFKDTISKTNTCFRQHHDFLKKNFSKKKIP